MRHALIVCGARGGHGATTTAAVLSLLSRRRYIGSELWTPRWILGANATPTAQGPTVVDGGCLSWWRSERPVDIAVLRGPCSIGLSTLVRHAEGVRDVMLIHEPWRALTRRDVEAAIARPIAIEIPFSERIARLCDAGLLGARLDKLDEYANLRRWIRMQTLSGQAFRGAQSAGAVDPS